MGVTSKMRSAVISALFFLQAFLAVPPHADGTVALTIGATTLSATTVSALAGLKLLGVSAGLLLGRVASRAGGTSTRSHRRGKRSPNKVDEALALAKATAALEQQQCFRRIFCAMATNQVKVQSLSALSSVVKEFPGKFADASKFGALMKDVGKCEARYKCDLQVGKMVGTL